MANFLKQALNGKASWIITRAVDCMIYDFSANSVKKIHGVEVLFRILMAILLTNITRLWDAADELFSVDNAFWMNTSRRELAILVN